MSDIFDDDDDDDDDDEADVKVNDDVDAVLVCYYLSQAQNGGSSW